MKWTLMTALLASMVMNVAPAADRQPVDKKVFELVRERLKLDSFRVYISKKVKINREASLSQQDNIDSGISIERQRKLQNERLSNKIRGKIIATKAHPSFDNPLLFVSFDKDCNDKSCSYVFSIVDGVAKLFFVPTYNMDKIKVETKKAVLYQNWSTVSVREMEGHAMLHSAVGGGGQKHRPILEYKLSENDTTVRDEVRNRGW